MPIYYACANGHAAVARLLLEFGADASSYVSGHSAVEMAGRSGHTECLRQLLHFGANIEDKGLSGSTALLSAVSGGHLETVHELLQRGASVVAFDFNEDTVLHLAAHLQSPVFMIRLLLKHGADKRMCNRQGYTPVRVALAQANSLAIEALGGRSAMVDPDADEVGDLARPSDQSDALSEERGKSITARSGASSVTFVP